MGSIRDYYRPSTSSDGRNIDLCYLLTHDNGFEWSPTAGGMGSSLSPRAMKLLEEGSDDWVKPIYNHGSKILGLLGGSNETWPKEIDGRRYLSLWGSAQAPGGCCHYESKLYTRDVNKEGLGTADLGGWGKTFRLDVIELPELQDSSDDPAEIVKDEVEKGANVEGQVNEEKEEDVRVSNAEKKNDLRSELSNTEKEQIQNKESLAKDREKEFAGLDELFKR